LNVQLTCRHCEVSGEDRGYAAEKTERLLKHFDGVHSVELILTVEGGKPKVELIVGVVRGRRCVAESAADDLRAAVDLAVDKLVRQLQKLKGKLRERHAKPTPEPPVTEDET